ncbi:hypothetical protein SB766_25255, partial [Pseudomonas sp. SIMBA_077]
NEKALIFQGFFVSAAHGRLPSPSDRFRIISLVSATTPLRHLADRMPKPVARPGCCPVFS